jgi:uncharacterized repeat protein (TIGR03943 family)
MGHDDSHAHEEDNYYLDQLCMVTMSAAFGGICLAMFFWKTDMLTRLLGPQFHLFVAISGFTLVGLAVLRAASLWVQVGRKRHAHDHNDEHDDQVSGHADSCHDHGTCHHDDEHSHGHAHDHAHTHEHHHHHDHGPEDHDHNWAPWRYVVLLVPVILFMLGLPNKGPKAVAEEAEFIAAELAKEARDATTLVAPGSPGWSQLAYLGYLGRDQVKGEIEDWDFKNLSPAVALAAANPDTSVQEQWKSKNIRVIGMYSPSPQSDREFRLVRFKLTCCVADAIQLNLPILSRESIRNIKPNSWVRVTGRVDFRKRLGDTVPILVVSSSQAVQPCAEDPNPYN